jgi:hypothetical protein
VGIIGTIPLLPRIVATNVQGRHQLDTLGIQDSGMKSLRLRLIAANRALAVLELETLPAHSPVSQLRSAFGPLGVRVVSSEGYLLDGGVRERIYIANLDGSPLTTSRVDQIHAEVCQAFNPDLAFPPEHGAGAAAQA